MQYGNIYTQRGRCDVDYAYGPSDFKLFPENDGVQLETAVTPEWEIDFGRDASSSGHAGNILREIEKEYGGRDDEPIVGLAAEQFEFEAQSHPERYEFLAKWFLREVLTGSVPGSIIDVGCGPGILTGMIAKELPDTGIIGLDISPDMLRLAINSNKSDQVRFVQGDVRDSLEIAERPVDAIVSRRMIHRVHGLYDVLSRMTASVKAEGGVVLNYSFRRPSDEAGKRAFVQACRLRFPYSDLHGAFVRAVLNAPTLEQYIAACCRVAEAFDLSRCQLRVFPFDVAIAMVR